MAEYLIHGSTLRDIADAIREKEESVDSIDVPDMASRIANIKTGSNVVSGEVEIIDSNVHRMVINCSFIPSQLFVHMANLSSDPSPITDYAYIPGFHYDGDYFYASWMDNIGDSDVMVTSRLGHRSGDWINPSITKVGQGTIMVELHTSSGYGCYFAKGTYTFTAIE